MLTTMTEASIKHIYTEQPQLTYNIQATLVWACLVVLKGMPDSKFSYFDPWSENNNHNHENK